MGVGTKKATFAHPQRQGRPQTRARGPLNSANNAPLNSREAVIQAAADKYGVPPEVLWGVFGVETGYGANHGTSSAGAQGWFQFEPATAAHYHVNVNDFRSSAFGAAHYLSDLLKAHGGNLNAALNAYNGNGGGASDTKYSTDVKNDAKTWKGGKGGTALPLTTGTDPISAAIGGAADVGQLIGILLDPTQFAKLLVDTGALMGRWAAQAVYKWVFLPPWHATQRAVDYYWTVDMADGSKALITIAWWATGYMVLHVDMDTGGLLPFGKPLAKPSKTPLGRLINHGKALAKSSAIVKPKRVESETANKPKPVESTVQLDRIRTLSASRRRAVTVTESGSNVDPGRGAGPEAGRGLRPEAPSAPHVHRPDHDPEVKPEAARSSKSGVDSQGRSGHPSTRHAGAIPNGNRTTIRRRQSRSRGN